MDVTERKELEEQLNAAQRMEAVAKLSGGVAHDFNNILAIILSYSELLRDQFHEGDPVDDDLQVIQSAAMRGAGLTRQLLAFSRRQPVKPEILDLNKILGNMDKMLRRLIGEDIELATNFGDNLGRIKADVGQLEQIVMNLAVNARDAMPMGGNMTIETANVYLDETYSKTHLASRPGDYVMLAVSDTGIGMDEETRLQIFEPFFTTKEMGKGTGLGLSTVYGIVKQFEGNIYVYSEPGQGTSIKISLPRTEDSDIEERLHELKTDVLRGTETILLVEDDDPVREAARRILEGAGYAILEASNGGEALLIAGHKSRHIDLVLTDVIMPRMSGRELADRLVSLWPHMCVLYMSGYTDDSIVHHGVLEEGINLLQKPFSKESLLRKVREVLEASNPK